MNSVFIRIKSSFAIYSTILLTLITRIKANSCALEQFQSCTAALDNLTDKGLTFGATKADLDNICPNLKKAIRCIHRYTRSCWPLDRHRHFQKLFSDPNHMIHDLCSNGTYQQEYLEFAPCMKQAAPENEICIRKYSKALKVLQVQDEQLTTPQAIISKKRRDIADERLKSLCCGFQEYVVCTTQTMSRKCGSNAGVFSRGFLDKMSNILVKEYCKAYGQEECGFSSSAYSSLSSSTTFISLLFSSLLVLFIS
ncbi:uncharacterized protein [Onthophagus taurus]|uniref:uncharacterized protein n=1 Tax=Onthophagus taurus TaxID=166361 RepID=UPI000C20582A|nr:uncharacterized protein LOC111426613 [Onthophagus taurus]